MTSTARTLLAAALLAVVPLRGAAAAELGTVIENVELGTIAGGTAKLLSPRAKVNVFVFFRTGQERTVDALKQLAACEKVFASSPVAWVGIVSSSEPLAEVRALVAQTGIAMPVLIDRDDQLYGKLLIRLHPYLGMVDARGRLVATEMYRQIDYCEIVKARIRLLLGEITEAQMQAVLEPARGTMPGDDPRDVARRDVNLGRMLLKRGNYAKAMESAQKALLKAPVASAFSLMGDIHAAQGDCTRARAQYDQALKLDPADRGAAAGRAACAGR